MLQDDILNLMNEEGFDLKRSFLNNQEDIKNTYILCSRLSYLFEEVFT